MVREVLRFLCWAGFGADNKCWIQLCLFYHREHFARAAFFLLSSIISPFNFWFWLGVSGNWIEIAYGTSSGAVRVIVQHPETVGSGPQLFQTFTVHRSPVTKIMLSEKHLVSGKVILLVLVGRSTSCHVKPCLGCYFLDSYKLKEYKSSVLYKKNTPEKVVEKFNNWRNTMIVFYGFFDIVWL